MALYDERKWRQTKDTEQLTFEAGEDLAYSTYVRENPVGSHVVFETTQDLAIGYVISQKGAVQGDPVDVHMLRGLGSSTGSGPSGGVQSVSDDGSGVVNVDNTDPDNPIVGFGGVNVDGATITGDGTVGDPLVSVGGGSVGSVTAGTNVSISGTATDPIVNAENIYTDNGTLNASRIVTLGANNLDFTGSGNFSVSSGEVTLNAPTIELTQQPTLDNTTTQFLTRNSFGLVRERNIASFPQVHYKFIMLAGRVPLTIGNYDAFLGFHQDFVGSIIENVTVGVIVAGGRGDLSFSISSTELGTILNGSIATDSILCDTFELGHEHRDCDTYVITVNAVPSPEPLGLYMEMKVTL